MLYICIETHTDLECDAVQLCSTFVVIKNSS